MSETPSRPVPLVVPAPARSARAFALIQSTGRRFAPVDAFAALNVALFLLMCVFTYYARFVHYRGAANIWEFFVYATVIMTGIALLWAFLRRFAFGIGLLTLLQIGILAHFAGGFIQFDGYRLYDCSVGPIRFDKAVHFFNAFVAALVLRHLFVRRRVRLDALNRVFILMVVLGLGAVLEIIEYVVWKTVPGNGVGGYDNNMQDLIANLAGTTLAVLTFWPAPSERLLRSALPPPPLSGQPFERTVSLVEILGLFAACLAVAWFAPRLVGFAWFVPAAQAALVAVAVYLLYVSPVRVHHDSLTERGLGAWRTLFIRTDNLRAAARRLGWLALAGTAVILLFAEMWNPGWFARANWKAWAVRAGFYAVSAMCQSLLVVGFWLVRLKRVVAGTPSVDLDAPQRFLVALLTGVAFGGLHAPGLALMGMTAVFGFSVAWISVRTPNVVAVAGCHAVLGLLVHRALELPMRLGAFYDLPDLHLMRTIVPLAQRAIGHLY